MCVRAYLLCALPSHSEWWCDGSIPMAGRLVLAVGGCECLGPFEASLAGGRCLGLREWGRVAQRAWSGGCGVSHGPPLAGFLRRRCFALLFAQSGLGGAVTCRTGIGCSTGMRMES